MRTTWVPAPRHPSLLLRGYSQWPTGWPLGSELTHAEEIHQIAVMLPTPAMCDGHPIKPSLWADPLVGPQRCEAAAPSRSGWTFRLTGPPTGGSVQSDAGCPPGCPWLGRVPRQPVLPCGSRSWVRSNGQSNVMARRAPSRRHALAVHRHAASPGGTFPIRRQQVGISGIEPAGVGPENPCLGIPVMPDRSTRVKIFHEASSSQEVARNRWTNIWA